MNASELDSLVGRALGDLAQMLAAGTWRGRENELVSLFAFGPLLSRACPPLRPTQIAIEVAVPQLGDWSPRPKQNVRKDLVLWREPDTNNWTPEDDNGARALAVMEWKSLNNVGVRECHPAKRREHRGDIDWLCRMTARSPTVTGYAVLVDLLSKPPIITLVVVRNGLIETTESLASG